MNCPDIKNLLSAYLDGELADELRADVSAHLERCPDCTHEFQGFEKLSRMASTLQSAVPPEHLWKRIETELDQSLDADRSRRQPMAWAARWFVASPRWMTAAALLVAIGISWFAYQAWTPQGKHEQFTADFSHYLTEFRRTSIGPCCLTRRSRPSVTVRRSRTACLPTTEWNRPT
jgi:anti-sigma factor RsiW